MLQGKPEARTASPAADAPTFRSGAVARMAHMPVATLRIWEQRYRAVQPATGPSGHRLYSPADVQRVLLLRRLTEQGHAIGSIASLDWDRLQQVSRQAFGAADGPATAADHAPARAVPAPRLVVVGSALAARLERPAVARHLAQAVQPVAVFASLTEAARAGMGTRADLLLWHAPELGPRLPPELKRAREACRAKRVAVVYRFAGSVATRALADAGAVMLREPADDGVLGTWLASVQAGRSQAAIRAGASEAAPRATRPPRRVAPRRFDDAALTAIAAMSPTLVCECPRHVAELLMQLSSFEAYSGACINRHAADAELHAYLQQVAGASRALFEAALERLALHEGLPLR